MKQTKNNSIQIKRSFHRLNPLQKAILLLVAILLTFSSFPIVLLLLIGMLPTLVILITDRQNYDKLIIVGCFNIAGVSFYLFNILNNFSVRYALSLAGDMVNLMLMLGSAGIGLVLYNELPYLYSSYIKSAQNKRIEKINERLGKLAEEWGEELNPKKTN